MILKILQIINAQALTTSYICCQSCFIKVSGLYLINFREKWISFLFRRYWFSWLRWPTCCLILKCLFVIVVKILHKGRFIQQWPIETPLQTWIAFVTKCYHTQKEGGWHMYNFISAPFCPLKVINKDTWKAQNETASIKNLGFPLLKSRESTLKFHIISLYYLYIWIL